MGFALVAALLLAPFPSDTPPTPPPLAALEKMTSLEHVVANTRLADGRAAPASLEPPGVLNQSEMVTYLRRNYPDTLRMTGAPHAGFFWMFIDAAGKLGEVRLIKSTGAKPFDALALNAVRTLKFAPANINGQAVGVWVPFPIHIGPLRQLEAFAQPPRSRPRPEDGPQFTPYTKKPNLLNRHDVQVALVRNYPSDLRDKGIGGTVLVWMLIDEDGNVAKTQVKQGSAYVALDEAALRVAEVMRWTPAMNKDKPAAVWIALPIVFKAK